MPRDTGFEISLRAPRINVAAYRKQELAKSADSHRYGACYFDFELVGNEKRWHRLSIYQFPLDNLIPLIILTPNQRPQLVPIGDALI